MLLILPHRLPLAVHRPVGKMQGGALAVVGQGGRIGRQLQGRHGGVALPDGCHQGQSVLVVAVGGPGQLPLGTGQFGAGVRPQAQQPGGGGKGIHPQPATHVIKIDVAAVL